MPIAPIAGEPRGIKTQDGSNLSRAKPRHEPLKTRPSRHSAGRAAKVVIDHLDALEPVAPRLVNEFVLPSLAFEIG